MTNIIYATDLDRTLIKDHMVASVLDAACLKSGLDVEALHRAASEIEAKGESFFPFSYLKESGHEEKIAELKAAFKSVVDPRELLYEDALPLIKRLKNSGMHVIILTYGDEEWQRLKLEVTGLDVFKHLIIPDTRKGNLIRSWQNASGYEHESITAKSVCLIDDKAKSFENLPADCTGYLLRRKDEVVMPSQEGSVPNNVKIVDSLSSIMPATA